MGIFFWFFWYLYHTWVLVGIFLVLLGLMVFMAFDDHIWTIRIKRCDE